MAQSVAFEILVATMFRSDFEFLEAMFPNKSYQDYHILVINQTDSARQLASEHPNVRVINTQERGLSRSRNMALKNAIGEVCLIGDDDVKYVPEVEEVVVSAFAKAKKSLSKSPAVITFQMTNHKGALYKKYPEIRTHTAASVLLVSSVEIALNRTEVSATQLEFDVHFGLGATFQTAEEYIFLRAILEKGELCLFENKVILSHPAISSGHFSGKDTIIFARAALRYKFMGRLAYLSMVKYTWFYYRRGEIAFKDIPSKIAVAFAGIKKYKSINPLSE